MSCTRAFTTIIGISTCFTRTSSVLVLSADTGVGIGAFLIPNFLLGSPFFGPLVHLVHDDVRDPAELGVALQPPQQDARGAVQQPGGRRLAAQRGGSQRMSGVSVRFGSHCCCRRTVSGARCCVLRYPDALQADLVAHGVAQRLGPLLRHPLGHGDGGDASRLRAEDVDDLVGRTAQRGVQDELRDLSGLTAPGERPHVQSLILSYS